MGSSTSESMTFQQLLLPCVDMIIVFCFHCFKVVIDGLWQIAQTGFELTHSVALEDLGLAVLLLPAQDLPPLARAEHPLSVRRGWKEYQRGRKAPSSYWFSFGCVGNGTLAYLAGQASSLPLP